MPTRARATGTTITPIHAAGRITASTARTPRAAVAGSLPHAAAGTIVAPTHTARADR
ncbi:hypothetical protein [Nocardia neocaledoniensis]|uniref:hypothetical protein n=1 Tax=Nocardia neocaledoniensis TaxID=236511 RepID=UPI0016499D9E|nr:hypothetical protein [Nocardia neocaledoniensis]